MELTEVREIINCLPKGRTLFHYCKDRYALMLLADLVPKSTPIEHLRRSEMAALLDKPVVKQALAQCGNGKICANDLLMHWPTQPQNMLLKLSYWGGDSDRRWQQTCRYGYNIVLQLLFANDHDQHYRRLTKPEMDSVFNLYCHPVAKRRRGAFYRETLAWARIDLDWQSGEALIEEIQSDWVSKAQRLRSKLKRGGKIRDDLGLQADTKSVLQYCEQVLASYADCWDEAMLSAAIQFIRHELGLEQIYYHDFDTGRALKGIDYGTPPRSLYTKLPRKFCFKRVGHAPTFIAQDKTARRVLKRVKNPVFHQLPH